MLNTIVFYKIEINFIENLLFITKCYLKNTDLHRYKTMRCKVLDHCSQCNTEIYWIDEENGWVHYVPIDGTDDGENNQEYQTLCRDCFEDEENTT